MASIALRDEQNKDAKHHERRESKNDEDEEGSGNKVSSGPQSIKGTVQPVLKWYQWKGTGSPMRFLKPVINMRDSFKMSIIQYLLCRFQFLSHHTAIMALI